MALEAARARFLQTVAEPPDESDPVYIKRKAEGMARLKGHFEQVFQKFENMPESMSDDIDMETGTVVVDRGHLKRMARQSSAWRKAEFLEDMLKDAPEGDEDDIDELAPPETETSSARAKRIVGKSLAVNAQPSEDSNTLPSPTTYDPTALPVQTTTPLALANSIASLDPAQLMQQLLQPQIPAGQQGQNAATSQLQQMMTNAFSSALRGVIQDITTVTPAPATPTLAVSSALTSSNHTQLRPGADPKWYFPVLPDAPPLPIQSYSSPSIPAATRKRRKSFVEHAQKRRSKSRASGLSESVAPVTKAATKQTAETDTPEAPVVHERQVSNKRKRHVKYTFTREDEAYIVQKKEVENWSWKAIWEGRPVFVNVPIFAIQQHYYKVNIKSSTTCNTEEETGEARSIEPRNEEVPKSRDVKDTSEILVSTDMDELPASEQPPNRSHPIVLIPNKASPVIRQRELLTPSSMISSGPAKDISRDQTLPEVKTIDSPENAESTQPTLDVQYGGMQDDQTFEEEEEDEASPAQSIREAAVTSLSPDEVLPSVEEDDTGETDDGVLGPLLGDDIELQAETLQATPKPVEVLKSTKTRSSNKKTTSKPVHVPRNRVDSETDLDLIPTSPPSQRADPFSCTACGATFRLGHELFRHELRPCHKISKIKPRSSPSAETLLPPATHDDKEEVMIEHDLPLTSIETPVEEDIHVSITQSDTEDELQMIPPPTPRIKVEPHTPPPVSALYGTPKTKPQLKSESTPRPKFSLLAKKDTNINTPLLSKKSFARQVRASWAKGGSKRTLGRRSSGLDLGVRGKGKGVEKRRSLPGSRLGVKREEEDTSEDELAG